MNAMLCVIHAQSLLFVPAADVDGDSPYDSCAGLVTFAAPPEDLRADSQAGEPGGIHSGMVTASLVKTFVAWNVFHTIPSRRCEEGIEGVS